MGLVEVAGVVNDIQNGNAALEKGGGRAGAFDLMNGATGQSGDLKDTALFGPGGEVLFLAAKDAFDSGIRHDEAATDEPLDEGVHVFKSGEFPC